MERLRLTQEIPQTSGSSVLFPVSLSFWSCGHLWSFLALWSSVLSPLWSPGPLSLPLLFPSPSPLFWLPMCPEGLLLGEDAHFL